MKSVLINDYKLFRNQIFIVIGLLIFEFVNFFINATYEIQIFNFDHRFWIVVLVYVIRAQLIFSDTEYDLDNFRIMPISAEDYSKAKLLKNMLIHFLTSLVMVAIILRFKHKINSNNILLFILFYISVDFTLYSLFHVLQTKSLKILFYSLYIILVISIVTPLIEFKEVLTRYNAIFWGFTIVLPIIAIILDYKNYTKVLKEMKE